MPEEERNGEVNANEFVVYYILVLVVAVILGVGGAFYHYIEGLSWLDSFYFCVVTLTTVGYGDFTPQTDIGKIFTMLYIFCGVGIFATFISTFFKRRANKFATRHKKHSDTEGSE